MGYSVFPAPSAGSSNKVFKQKVFQTSGTWTYPSASTFNGEVEVTVVGAGGSGGGYINPSSYAYSVPLLTGGGAGGQVLLRQRMSVYGLGNQTVTIGDGGTGGYSSSAWASMPGEDSYFGNYVAANAVYCPEMTHGLTYMSNTNVGSYVDPEKALNYLASASPNPAPTYKSTQSGITPYFGSMSLLQTSGADNGFNYFSDWFQVKSSTSYLFGHYYNYGPSGTSQSATWNAKIDFYDKYGAYISASTLGTVYSNVTWTKLSATITTPSNAYYAKFRWTDVASSGDAFVCGLFAAETASGVTTVVSGNTSGYKWASTVGYSPTVLETTPLSYALGGSPGEGLIGISAGSGGGWKLPSTSKFGIGGASRSGTSSSTAYANFAGNGAGAGGPATLAIAYGPGSTVGSLPGAESNDDSVGWTTYRAARNRYANFGGGYAGTEARAYNGGAATQFWKFNFGTNGPDLEGYSAGGMGGYQYNANSFANISRQTFGSIIDSLSQRYSYGTYRQSGTEYLMDARPNTGNGGNGMYVSNSSSTSSFRAGNGGSGVVIVRWYE